METLSSVYTVQGPAREWSGSSHSGNQVIPLTEAPAHLPGDSNVHHVNS